MTGMLLSKRFIEVFGEQLNDVARSVKLIPEILHQPDDPQRRLPQTDADRIEVAFLDSATRFSSHYKNYCDTLVVARNLKFLHVLSAGVDQFAFVPELISRGTRITSSAGIQADAVAQTAITGLLMLARRFPLWQNGQRRHAWEPMRNESPPEDLQDQTVMVVGLGAIGMRVARVCKALGMAVIGIRRLPKRQDDPLDEIHSPSEFARLLPRCQWLVLACPYNKETHHLLNARTLAMLPQRAGVINVARGAVVDEMALIAALKNGQLGGAYLDVFEQEPLPAESPLWDMPNVILTPHIAGNAAGNERRSSEIFLANLERWVRGESLLNEQGAGLP